jgi:hypothetical protein
MKIATWLRRPSLLLIAAVVAAAVCVAPVAGAQRSDASRSPVSRTRTPEQAAVLAVVDSAMAAINRGDMIALSNTMTDSGQVYATRDVNGTPSFAMRTAASQRAAGQRPPIIERGFDADVRIAGGVASVWLPYDLWFGGKWSHCGVDHFTLVRTGTAWRIANLTYSVEQPPACRMHPSGPPPGHEAPKP